MSQRAQSVPRTMLDTRQIEAQPGSSYHTEFLLAAHGHAQKAGPGYHSLSGKDHSCYLSSLSEWAILLPLVLKSMAEKLAWKKSGTKNSSKFWT